MHASAQEDLHEIYALELVSQLLLAPYPINEGGSKLVICPGSTFKPETPEENDHISQLFGMTEEAS